MSGTPIRLLSQPGIKRDGTRLEGENYVDGQWVRFQRGLPRKMGGYRAASKYMSYLPRTLVNYTLDDTNYIHFGAANYVGRLSMDTSFNTSAITNRAPDALTIDARNMWQMDFITKAGEGLQIIAQVAPNLDSLNNSTGGELYYGSAFGTDQLQPIVPPPGNVSGGIFALHPYAVAHGADGFVGWSTPGDPTDFYGTGAGSAYVTGQKIIRGLQMRGGPGASPSALLWSADSLIRMTFNNDTTSVFSFDTISSQVSLMSAQSVIENDGIFYWLAADRFLMFNGVVREVENQMNINYLLDNMNYTFQQKSFAFRVPRFGEIWWCVPLFGSEEPNHAIIYNVRENCWYDTPLPNGGRSAAASPAVFRKPIVTGVEPRLTPESLRITESGDFRVLEDGSTFRETEDSLVGLYRLWVHEMGTDEIDGTDINPVRSYFETAEISLPVSSQQSKSVILSIVEPDFVQAGDMTVTLTGNYNARSPTVDGETMTIPETPSEPLEQITYFKDQRRQLRLRFESNVLGGNYEMGHILVHIEPGDGRITG